MPDPDLKPGDIGTGLEPNEHVEIRRVAPFGGKTLIEGITVTAHDVLAHFIVVLA